MKKLVLAVAIIVTAFGGTARANDYQDNVGVYFDANATEFCMNNIENMYFPLWGGLDFHAFVVMSELTSDIVAGYEFVIGLDSPLSLKNVNIWETEFAAINVMSAPSFKVGLGIPQPVVGGKFIPVEFDINVYTTQYSEWDEHLDAYVYMNGYSADQPFYWDDPVMLFSLDRSGCTSIPPTSTEKTSWDALKSLYR